MERDYAMLAALVEDASAVVSDEALLQVCVSGDVCALRLLLDHWTSDPNSVLIDCIRHCTADVLVAIVEQPRTKITDEALILACRLGRTSSISTLLKDKRFDPTTVAETCIAELVKLDTVQPLITFLSDKRLRELTESCLFQLSRAGKNEAFENVISKFPCSSLDLLQACWNNDELLEACLKCSTTAHKKGALMCCPINKKKLGLVVETAGEDLAATILLMSIRQGLDWGMELVLAKHSLCCPGALRDCPIAVALHCKNEERCMILIRGANPESLSCPHLEHNSLLAVQWCYMSVLGSLLPSLVKRVEIERAEVVMRLLASNEERMVLALLNSGYRVSENSLCFCLKNRYYITVRTVRSRQTIDLSWNNYELLRIASSNQSDEAFRAALYTGGEERRQ